jgi:O-methyltransferase
MAENESYYEECYDRAKSNFASFPRAVLDRGIVPATLSSAPVGEICYLYLDKNIAYPEVAAMEHFWDTLVRGAPVILDDYGFVHYEEQKRAMDEFAASKGVRIATLLTGQGLLIKA